MQEVVVLKQLVLIYQTQAYCYSIYKYKLKHAVRWIYYLKPSGGTVAVPNNYTYAWDSGLPNKESNWINCRQPNVTVFDDNNCSSTITITVNSATIFNLNLTTSNSTCNGLNNGGLTATNNATNPVYSWNNGLAPNKVHTGLSL